MNKLPVVAFATSLPNNLLTAEELSSQLKERGVLLSAERITELAAAYYIPHFRVDDGPPVFALSEARKWISANLAKEIKGQDLPAEYRIVAEPGTTVPGDCPMSISLLADRLIAQAPIVNVSGVYFLCRLGRVVYVGQSVSTGSRIATHVAAGKTFDRAYILPLPPSQLDAVEGAFIRLLKPEENDCAPVEYAPDAETLAALLPEARELHGEFARLNFPAISREVPA